MSSVDKQLLLIQPTYRLRLLE